MEDVWATVSTEHLPCSRPRVRAEDTHTNAWLFQSWNTSTPADNQLPSPWDPYSLSQSKSRRVNARHSRSHLDTPDITPWPQAASHLAEKRGANHARVVRWQLQEMPHRGSEGGCGKSSAETLRRAEGQRAWAGWRGPGNMAVWCPQNCHPPGRKGGDFVWGRRGWGSPGHP